MRWDATKVGYAAAHEKREAHQNCLQHLTSATTIMYLPRGSTVANHAKSKLEILKTVAH